jgi:hypothetical protein
VGIASNYDLRKVPHKVGCDNNVCEGMGHGREYVFSNLHGIGQAASFIFDGIAHKTSHPEETRI